MQSAATSGLFRELWRELKLGEMLNQPEWQILAENCLQK